jgi:hypothetical protein
VVAIPRRVAGGGGQKGRTAEDHPGRLPIMTGIAGSGVRAGAGRRAAVLLCLFLAGCNIAGPARVEAPADTLAGEIAFAFEGRGEAALVVPVFVNGEGPWNFVLDTGATITCVEREIAERLVLAPVRGVVGVGAGVGGTGRLELVRFDSLAVGQARAFRLDGCLLDLEHLRALGADVHGLLGLDFLRRFRVSLDFERNVVTLTAP